MQINRKNTFSGEVFHLLRGVAITFAICLFGYFLLVVVYCLPTGPMEKNVLDSCRIFSEEGVYPELTGIETSQVDNSTDALMFLIASYPSMENVWKAAAGVERYRVEGKDPVETLLYIYEEDGKDFEHVSYSRYWHGYLVFLKPLLGLFDYGGIRFVLMLFQLSLFLLIVLKLANKRKELIFPIFFMWLFMNPIATMSSLQFNNVTLVTWIAILLMLYLEEQWKMELSKWELLFVVIGALTSYLDLLTYPLVTLGVPLSLWLALNRDSSMGFKIKGILLISVFWSIGYAGMWAGKWVLGSIITGENVFENAVEVMQVRTSSIVEEDQGVTYWEVIECQMSIAGRYMFLAVAAAGAFLTFYSVKMKKLDFQSFFPYVIVGLYPFIWYLILKNHSYIHAFFTYRELAITIFACCVYIAVQCKRKGDHQL